MKTLIQLLLATLFIFNIDFALAENYTSPATPSTGLSAVNLPTDITLSHSDAGGWFLAKRSGWIYLFNPSDQNAVIEAMRKNDNEALMRLAQSSGTGAPGVMIPRRAPFLLLHMTNNVRELDSCNMSGDSHTLVCTVARTVPIQ